MNFQWLSFCLTSIILKYSHLILYFLSDPPRNPPRSFFGRKYKSATEGMSNVLGTDFLAKLKQSKVTMVTEIPPIIKI